MFNEKVIVISGGVSPRAGTVIIGAKLQEITGVKLQIPA